MAGKHEGNQHVTESSSEQLNTEQEIPSPTIDVFAETLSLENDWYSLGIFLGAPGQEMDDIGQNHRSMGRIRCLIELYKCLERRGKCLSWENIANALRRIGNHDLAEKIHSRFIKKGRTTTDNGVPLSAIELATETFGSIANEYLSLSNRFEKLLMIVKRAVRIDDVDMSELQDVVRRQCGLSPLPQESATIDAVFTRIEEQCSIVNFHVIEFLVENLLSNGDVFLSLFAPFKEAVDRFKYSANMVKLVSLISKAKQQVRTVSEDQKTVRLKVREFWNDFTIKQFEIVMNKIFRTLYNIMQPVTIEQGCICITWVIPDIDTTKLLPVLPLELVRLIGVIYLHIGSDVIYNIEGEGCESIEAAMLLAIELKNTRAIKLLLAVGCNPEVATYNGDNVVTSIVNIKPIESKELSSSGSSHSVDHMCILGHNQHVEAIINPTASSELLECNSCAVRKKMNRQLHQEIDDLRDVKNQQAIEFKREKEQLHQEIDDLRFKKKDTKLEQELTKTDLDVSSIKSATLELSIVDKMKHKNAENALLKKTNESLIIDVQSKETSIVHLRSELAILKSTLSSTGTSTALLPHKKRLGIKAEMKVRIITRDDSSGKALATGGSEVKAILTCNEGECPVTDNNDGTYTVSVIPHLLGQSVLSITVNGRYIQGSPFRLDIVPQRDYTQIPISGTQTIPNVNQPIFIAFSDNGDLFVTSDDHQIRVYDRTVGKLKYLIGSRVANKLQFLSPYGIDIRGDMIYVAEYSGHRIRQLTTKGQFIGTFGKSGLAIGSFYRPFGIKISPDDKVYVAESGNDRIQVFNPDWSISHIIYGKDVIGGVKSLGPEGIAFDLLGNVHIAGYAASLVAVFTSTGQFVRRYGDSISTLRASGIAIDSSGYSWVSSVENGLVSIFDPNGTFVRSLTKLRHPSGVSVSPIDGSIWVSDNGNNRLIKY